jgi:Novel STAND NTPase 1
VEALIALLASKRLVSTSGLGRESPMENYVEVSHEALIREWPALREWLKENREDPTAGRTGWQPINPLYCAFQSAPVINCREDEISLTPPEPSRGRNRGPEVMLFNFALTVCRRSGRRW